MKKARFLPLIFFFGASPLLAQTFPKPPEFPDFIYTTPTYNTTNGVNVPLDYTTPYPVGQLTNIPVPSLTGRVVTNGPYPGTGSPFCLTVSDGGTCQEKKLRLHVDCGYILPDDPIRNYGLPGTSHLHQFCGGGSTNAYSTYKSLRNHALNSLSSGIDINGTGYWRPPWIEFNPYGDGKNFAIIDDFWTVYYRGGKAPIPIGAEFVGGFDMDSTSFATQFAWLQPALDAANTAQGYTRYRLTNNLTNLYYTTPTQNCSGAATAIVLQDGAGTDVWGGTCASGALFYSRIEMPNCYSGYPWSPGGYKNMIPKVWDTHVSGWTCPQNYWEVPQVIIEFQTQQYGSTDRLKMDLSSDIAYRAKNGLSKTQVPPGMTFHTDWKFGWDNNIFAIAEAKCAGVADIGHECNSGQYDDSHRLVGSISNDPGLSRVKQVDFANLPHINETDPGWASVPAAWSGSVTGMTIRHP